MSRTKAPDRFDEHFIVRTIRDFFISLLVIITVELGARFGLMLWTYNTVEAQRTQIAAERLAEDVRAIMLNRGGPVAARTVYPVIERNHDLMGLDIAVEPAPATVAAITDMLGTPPRGIPADWPSGLHHEARIAIVAEEFCTACHHNSEPGDTLGWATVRNYRAVHVARWLEDVWLSGLFGMGNIIMHTIVLFVLLRLRMEPLLSLRAVVAQLARAGSDLGHRAPVRSPDEFGELAHDLNLFLGRLTLIIEDMSRVLAEIDDISSRMQDMGDAIDRHARALSEQIEALPRGLAGEAAGLDGLLAALADVAAHLGLDDAARARIAAARARLAEVATAGDVAAVNEGLSALGGSAGEMRVLEERMRALSAEGQRLLARLGHARAETPQAAG